MRTTCSKDKINAPKKLGAFFIYVIKFNFKLLFVICNIIWYNIIDKI